MGNFIDSSDRLKAIEKQISALKLKSKHEESPNTCKSSPVNRNHQHNPRMSSACPRTGSALSFVQADQTDEERNESVKNESHSKKYLMMVAHLKVSAMFLTLQTQIKLLTANANLRSDKFLEKIQADSVQLAKEQLNLKVELNNLL